MVHQRYFFDNLQPDQMVQLAFVDGAVEVRIGQHVKAALDFCEPT